jgi:hypothetical protein
MTLAGDERKGKAEAAARDKNVSGAAECDAGSLEGPPAVSIGPQPILPPLPQCPHLGCGQHFNSWARARGHVKYCKYGKHPRKTIAERERQ